MSYFEYRPLTPHKARIRLIDVLPETHHQSVESPLDQHHGDRALSESSNPVSCTLSHVSLEAAPAYTALSYNWGDTAQRVGILVNGATIMVTLNLEAALRHLRLQDKPLTLWVDFLCIDQSDEVEKSEQLEQMRQIYVQALSVVAWLGPAESNSDAALHWIQQYGRRSLDLGIGTKPELRLQYLLEALEETGKGLVDARLRKFAEDLKKDLSPTSLENADIINALSRLFTRPYWSRVWVIQELSSASRLIFMCGDRTVKHDYLNHAVRLLRNFGQYQHLQRTHDSPIAHSPGVSVNSINTYDPISLIKLRRAAVPSPLVHLMRSFRRFQATDPRDKVFALLGIARDTEALGLHPDYRKSCQEVYSNLARTLIQNGYVEVLSLCEFPKQVDGLPSWVHDWSAKSYRSPLQQRSLDRRARPLTSILEPKFSASGANQTISPKGGHTTSWRTPLLLRATFLGEVQQVGMSWERDAFGRWLHDLQKLSSLIPDTSIFTISDLEQRALALLNGRRRASRPNTEPAKSIPELSRMPSLDGGSDLKGTPSILGMKHWLDELGHSAASINNLNIIHVAGTKGKGSTCAFIDSILRAHGRRTGYPQKVGLYTSPHLIYPEERIRINFEPLPKDLFTKYIFEVDDLLSRSGPHDFAKRPRYLQLFALLAFHTFISEGVDAAIFETHHGGEYDSTNVIEKPIITAITTLGLDHVKQLGSSIESIAWHKAGIFKSGALAFSAPQETTAAEVLRKRASDKGVSLQFVDPDPSLPTNVVQLKPDVQRTNCSVALATVRSFLDQKDNKSRSRLSSSDILQGISQFSWPGRFQLVIDNQFQWFLDGAHNEMSVSIAAEWFLETSKMQTITSPVARILIFSLITDQRDAAAVFERLAASLASSEIQYAIFTTYERDQDSESKNNPQPKILGTPSRDQQVYATIWRRAQPDTSISFEPTIQGALELARKLGEGHGSVQTLITGSQHLVGGALSLLQTTETRETGNETEI